MWTVRDNWEVLSETMKMRDFAELELLFDQEMGEVWVKATEVLQVPTLSELGLLREWLILIGKYIGIYTNLSKTQSFFF